MITVYCIFKHSNLSVHDILIKTWIFFYTDLYHCTQYGKQISMGNLQQIRKKKYNQKYNLSQLDSCYKDILLKTRKNIWAGGGWNFFKNLSIMTKHNIWKLTWKNKSNNKKKYCIDNDPHLFLSVASVTSFQPEKLRIPLF